MPPVAEMRSKMKKPAKRGGSKVYRQAHPDASAGMRTEAHFNPRPPTKVAAQPEEGQRRMGRSSTSKGGLGGGLGSLGYSWLPGVSSLKGLLEGNAKNGDVLGFTSQIYGWAVGDVIMIGLGTIFIVWYTKLVFSVRRPWRKAMELRNVKQREFNIKRADDRAKVKEALEQGVGPYAHLSQTEKVELIELLDQADTNFARQEEEQQQQQLSAERSCSQQLLAAAQDEQGSLSNGKRSSVTERGAAKKEKEKEEGSLSEAKKSSAPERGLAEGGGGSRSGGGGAAGAFKRPLFGGGFALPSLTGLAGDAGAAGGVSRSAGNAAAAPPKEQQKEKEKEKEKETETGKMAHGKQKSD
jgi:hypothetical protein